MGEFISIPKFQESQGELYKLKLTGEVLEKFTYYQQAYKEAYGKSAESQDLLCYLVDFALNKDPKFKKWYKTKKQEAAIAIE